MIFNFFIYKCPKSSLNWPKSLTNIKHKFLCAIISDSIFLTGRSDGQYVIRYVYTEL